MWALCRVRCEIGILGCDVARGSERTPSMLSCDFGRGIWRRECALGNACSRSSLACDFGRGIRGRELARGSEWGAFFCLVSRFFLRNAEMTVWPASRNRALGPGACWRPRRRSWIRSCTICCMLAFCRARSAAMTSSRRLASSFASALMASICTRICEFVICKFSTLFFRRCSAFAQSMRAWSCWLFRCFWTYRPTQPSNRPSASVPAIRNGEGITFDVVVSAAADGLWLGLTVGNALGTIVGDADGAGVGNCDGAADGDVVGTSDGDELGVREGFAVLSQHARYPIEACGQHNPPVKPACTQRA